MRSLFRRVFLHVPSGTISAFFRQICSSGWKWGYPCTLDALRTPQLAKWKAYTSKKGQGQQDFAKIIYWHYTFQTRIRSWGDATNGAYYQFSKEEIPRKSDRSGLLGWNDHGHAGFGRGKNGCSIPFTSSKKQSGKGFAKAGSVQDVNGRGTCLEGHTTTRTQGSINWKVVT